MGVLAQYEMVIGHDDHARDIFEEIFPERDPVSDIGIIGWGYSPAINSAHLPLKSGDAGTAAVMLEDARRALAPALEDRYTAGGANYLLASISAIEGQTDEAMDLLEKAIASGWTSHWYAPRDPNLESLWSEPRFQALIADLRSEMDRLRLAM